MSQIPFYRPDNEQDKIERENIINEIVPKIQAYSTDDTLRYHSTSISNAKRIFESKQISSSADRYDGFDASTDGVGRISVATREKLDWSASYWLNLYS